MVVVVVVVAVVEVEVEVVVDVAATLADVVASSCNCSRVRGV